MKLFISWSGTRGNALAAALHSWLPQAVEGVVPFFSGHEINSGVRWFERISKELHNSHAGLVCITPESMESPWLHFEAGALASIPDRPLYTYLHAVAPKELAGALDAFQSNDATRDGTLKLVKAMAEQSRAAPFDEERFNSIWPKLDHDIQQLNAVSIEAAVPGFAELFEHKTFIEPLHECRDFNWIGRIERVAGVQALLQARKEGFQALGLEKLHRELCGHLDKYAMGLRSPELVQPHQFAHPEDIPSHVLHACETPRAQVRELVKQLLNRSAVR